MTAKIGSLVLVWWLALPETAVAAVAGCDRFWQSQGIVREHDVQMSTNSTLPEYAQPIDGFVVKSFTRSDGSAVIPRSLEESNCYLERALPRKLKKAFKRGLQDTFRNMPEKTDRSVPDTLIENINKRIDQTLGGSRRAGGLGFFVLAVHLQITYGFVQWDATEQTLLQREISGLGVCSTNYQLAYVLVNFIVSMCETDSVPENFKSYFEAGNCN